MKFGFHKKYAILSFGLFMVEISIALFIHDRLIRPFVGDMLVVILIFTICRSFINPNYFWLAFCVLIFSFAVEIGQYFNIPAKGFSTHSESSSLGGEEFGIAESSRR
jgi:hypothetical protein